MNALSPYRVLVVDDDAGDVALVSQAIDEGPFPCIIERARDGIEAMERLRPPTDESDRISMPHLVLLDINMPRKSGIQVLEEIRADPALNHLPVVIMSTSTSDWDIATAYRAGAGGYIAKPLEIDDLFRAIHGVEEYWFGVVRRPD
jgi:CheY-like chemotaxis protein